jgi:hypothetical protein
MKCYPPHEIKDTNIITWVQLYQSLYHGLDPVSALGTDTGYLAMIPGLTQLNPYDNI